MPTSATNKPASARKPLGFTLVELLVVFAIGALLIAVAPPAYERMRETAQYKNSLHQLLTDLRTARGHARARGQWVGFRFNLQSPGYHWDDAGPKRKLPAPLQLRVTTGDTLITPGHNALIWFLPDGGSSGGSVELLRPNGAGTKLRIDWLTGEITQEKSGP